MQVFMWVFGSALASDAPGGWMMIRRRMMTMMTMMTMLLLLMMMMSARGLDLDLSQCVLYVP
jgi:hypothetical protein